MFQYKLVSHLLIVDKTTVLSRTASNELFLYLISLVSGLSLLRLRLVLFGAGLVLDLLCFLPLAITLYVIILDLPL